MDDENSCGDGGAEQKSGYSAVYSSGSSPGPDAFEAWRHLITKKFRSVPEPAPVLDNFQARIACARFDGFSLARMTAAEHRNRRTKRQIEDDDPHYFMVNVMVSGSGCLEQEGRVATFRAGDVTIWDTTLPCTLQFDTSYELVLLRLPYDHARNYAPIRTLRQATAVTLPSSGAGRLLAGYFTGLASLVERDAAAARALSVSGAALITSALTLAAQRLPQGEPARQLRRDQVVQFLRANLANPNLTADSIAQATQLSRRALYRLFEGDSSEGSAGIALKGASVIETLRWLRVEQAKQMLTAFPERNLRSIAQACGFGSEVQFHRAFKQLTGTTPGQYRCSSH